MEHQTNEASNKIEEKRQGFGFDHLNLDKRILEALYEMQFKNPTPIQEKGLPLLMQGEDLIGQAQTGTGKTAAFGICILEKLAQKQYHPHTKRPVSALVLAPTRELAMQVCQEIKLIGRHIRGSAIPVYGGVSLEPQIRHLEAGVDVVIGTPGRILDHIERGTLDLSHVETVVLDEADRMLDMGFIYDVEEILSKTPQERQTMLFSATMPPQILNLSDKYLKNPQLVKVSEDTLTVENIKQHYLEITKFNRLYTLLTLLTQKKGAMLIFVRTKFAADKLDMILKANGHRSLCLHGDLSQNKRDRTMEEFKRGSAQILVATDLASRGLHVENIACVINYDMPEDPLTYVHRIGRTGRMGKDGESISFVFGDEMGVIRMIENVTESKMDKIMVEVSPESKFRTNVGTGSMPDRGGYGRGGGSGRSGGYGRDSGPRGAFGRGGHGRGRDGDSRSGHGRGGSGGYGRSGGSEGATGGRGGYGSGREGGRGGYGRDSRRGNERHQKREVKSKSGAEFYLS